MPERSWPARYALSPSSAVSISGGTLDISGFANTVQSLSISSGGLNLGVGNLLSSSAVSLAGTVNVAGSVDDVTGKYALVTSSSMSGTPAYTYTGLSGTNPGDYLARINGSELDLQHKANQGLTSASPATIYIISGATTGITATLTNTAPSSSINLNLGLADYGSSGGTVSALSSNTGSTVAVGTPGTISGTFTAGAVGTGLTWSIENSDSNSITTSVSASGTVNVYNHSAPTLTVATGNNQTIISGGTLAAVTLTLSNTAGNTPAPLDVNSLSNLTGGSGSVVVSSGGSTSYTATGFETSAVGQNNSLSTSLNAGDSATVVGASGLNTLSASVTYSVRITPAPVYTPATLDLGTVHAGYAGSITTPAASAWPTATAATSGRISRAAWFRQQWRFADGAQRYRCRRQPGAVAGHAGPRHARGHASSARA